MDEYLDLFSLLFECPVFSLSKQQKKTAFLPVLNALHQHHKVRSEQYLKIARHFEVNPSDIETFPYVAVRLFKQFALSSIRDEDVFRTLMSSGTTGQIPARVMLDRETSSRQSKVLVKIMQNVLGKKRLPMLIVDSPNVLKAEALSARAAGVQGMSFFGRQPVYALNEDMTLNLDVVTDFVSRYSGEPCIVFGFTFMVWQYFIQAISSQGVTVSLDNAVLIHSGGWKKLEHLKVDNNQFKRELLQTAGIRSVHNFYGMAEQVGSIFVECKSGHLHVPSFADLIVRNTKDLSPVGVGEVGLVQVLSSIPTSYPGYSILTEDLGRILGEDDCSCGWKGKYFEILGRLPKAEVRGCSDTETKN